MDKKIKTYIKFENDDEGYLQWVAENCNGFVLNIQKKTETVYKKRNKKKPYAMIHSCYCTKIKRKQKENLSFTERYIKYCSLDIKVLNEICTTNNDNVSYCKICLDNTRHLNRLNKAHNIV
jgi:hypothetical protein